jgi:hypothetical protein
MLLIGAGLAMKSFVNLQRVNPGIRPDHVLTFRMRLPTDNLYKTGREQAEFYRRVLDKVEALPGIQSVGLTDVLPLGGQNDREYFTIENRPLPPEQSLVADFRRVSPRYFNTMGIALQRGRMLSDHDAANAPPVILIDETCGVESSWPSRATPSADLLLEFPTARSDLSTCHLTHLFFGRSTENPTQGCWIHLRHRRAVKIDSPYLTEITAVRVAKNSIVWHSPCPYQSQKGWQRV